MDSRKHLSASELDQLHETLERFEDSDFRNVTLIRLALMSGGRASEILGLTVNALNDAERSVLIRGTKGSNDREIPLKKSLYEALKRLALASTDLRIFPISYPRLAQVWDLYRPTSTKGFHSLRHTFAIETYRKVKDVRLLKYTLGHRNISNTMIYADYVYTQAELRRLLR